MPELFTTIGPWRWPTFMLATALAILITLVGAGWTLRRSGIGWGRLADAGLGALLGGLVGARLGHVLLHWDYFSNQMDEARNLAGGGLDWHGAVLGGLLGLWLALSLRARLDQQPVGFARLLGALSPALPLIGLGAWYGCLAAGCGYGREVDTLASVPGWSAAELVDVYGIVAPRFATPFFGMTLSGAALALLLLSRVFIQRPLGVRSFGWLLAFLSAGMFLIGFLRDDPNPILFGLRADQVLDALLCAFGLVMALRYRTGSKERSARNAV